MLIQGASKHRRIFSISNDGEVEAKETEMINPYLVAGPNVMVNKAVNPLSNQTAMSFGNKPVDGGHLLLTTEEVSRLSLQPSQHEKFVRRIMGSAEFVRGTSRYCLWITDDHLKEAIAIPSIYQRIDEVRKTRLASRDKGANELANRSHQFREMNVGIETVTIIPSVSSESRDYLPVGYCQTGTIVSNLAVSLFDAPLWNMALIASRIHLVWIATVCGKLETRYRYSNTLGWNTFPVPTLTEKNKADLTCCAEDILLAREAHFPATIADLYHPKNMPADLREAHERNDEVLERIYIGRRFKNDTERLEKLFELYTKMTALTTTAKKLKSGK